MHSEYFSGFEDKKSLERFDGKHHVIAGIALQSFFEGEEDIRNALLEMMNE